MDGSRTRLTLPPSSRGLHQARESLWAPAKCIPSPGGRPWQRDSRGRLCCGPLVESLWLGWSAVSRLEKNAEAKKAWRLLSRVQHHSKERNSLRDYALLKYVADFAPTKLRFAFLGHCRLLLTQELCLHPQRLPFPVLKLASGPD